MQETFARVLARPRLLQADSSELAYLLRVLRNTFLTGRRDAGRPALTTAALDEMTVAKLKRGPRRRRSPRLSLASSTR